MDRHFTLDHILHFRCFGNKPKPVAGVKLAWTDTFRHLISSLHSWGRSTHPLCKQFKPDRRSSAIFSHFSPRTDEHQAVCAAPHITHTSRCFDAQLTCVASLHWFLIWESKLAICSDRLSIRCLLLNCMQAPERMSVSIQFL